MSVAYFLHVDGPTGQHEELQNWADEVLGPALNHTGLAQSIEVYTPQTADDPYLHLGESVDKLLIVQADFADKDKLEAAMANPRVADAFKSMPDHGEFQLAAEALTAQQHPLQDGSISPRRAPLSFVVRYYRPIENTQAFTQYYVDHHPPIMANFPNIRNIFCYFPLEWKDANQLPHTNSFLGNEIVFDGIDDLNAALTSDTRHDLRADFHYFPPHEGTNSHHAMLRRVICG
jgi:hypothetical protein